MKAKLPINTKVDLLTCGGSYLQTFSNLLACAQFFGCTIARIRMTLANNQGITRNGIRYKIRLKEENNVEPSNISR